MREVNKSRVWRLWTKERREIDSMNSRGVFPETEAVLICLRNYPNTFCPYDSALTP